MLYQLSYAHQGTLRKECYATSRLVATDERRATESGTPRRPAEKQSRRASFTIAWNMHSVAPVAISFFAFCDGGRTSMFSLVPGQRERHREIA